MVLVEEGRLELRLALDALSPCFVGESAGQNLRRHPLQLAAVQIYTRLLDPRQIGVLGSA